MDRLSFFPTCVHYGRFELVFLGSNKLCCRLVFFSHFGQLQLLSNLFVSEPSSWLFLGCHQVNKFFTAFPKKEEYNNCISTFR